MSDQSLILSSGTQVEGFSIEAEAMKTSALEQSALIARVSNASQNGQAVAAIQDIHTLLATIEKIRVELKAPALEFGRKLDAAVKKWVKDLGTEELRLNTEIGNYQQIEQARLRDAMVAAASETNSIEQRRHAELSQATTEEARDEINSRYDEEARAIQVPVAVRASGQVVRDDWEIEILNLDLLYQTARQCVKLEPIISEIKKLLNHGIVPKGIKATPITKNSVRTTKKETVEI